MKSILQVQPCYSTSLCVSSLYSAPVPAWPLTCYILACGDGRPWSTKTALAWGSLLIGCCASLLWFSWRAAVDPVATRWRRSFRGASCPTWTWRTFALLQASSSMGERSVRPAFCLRRSTPTYSHTKSMCHWYKQKGSPKLKLALIFGYTSLFRMLIVLAFKPNVC